MNSQVCVRECREEPEGGGGAGVAEKVCSKVNLSEVASMVSGGREGGREEGRVGGRKGQINMLIRPDSSRSQQTKEKRVPEREAQEVHTLSKDRNK